MSDERVHESKVFKGLIRELQVEKLLNLYGSLALPRIALDSKVIAIGVIEPSQAAEALKEVLQGR